MPRFHASQLLTAAADVRTTAGAPDTPLLGSWSATRWEYTGRDGRRLDLVCDLGGSITLSLSAGTYVLAWDVAGLGKQSIGGTFAARGDELDLVALGAERVDAVRIRVSAETLALSSEDSAWDFENAGREQAATFVAVLVRL